MLDRNSEAELISMRLETRRKEVTELNTKKLKVLLLENDMSQRQLSAATGMNKNTLNSKINGKTPINTDEAIAICDALNIQDAETKVDIFLSKTSHNAT